MSWEALKSAVTAVISANGNEEITGQVLQNLINNNLIPQLGVLQFKGVAIPDTVPENSDAEVFYISAGYGSFSNFGLTIPDGKTCIIFKVSQTWVFRVLFDSPDSINIKSSNHQIKFPNSLVVAAGSGASQEGNTLSIPVGQIGTGSFTGSRGIWGDNLPSQNITYSTLDEFVVYSVFRITGSEVEIPEKLTPLIIESWSTGNVVDNSNFFINEKIGTNTYLLASRIDSIQQKSLVKNAQLERLFVGYSVTDHNTSQTMEVEILESSTNSIKLIASDKGIIQHFMESEISKLVSDLDIKNTYIPSISVDNPLYEGYSRVLAGAANDAVISKDSESRITLFVPQNGNATSINMGMANYIIEAGVEQTLEVLIEVNEIDIFDSSVSKYFLYNINGVRTIASCQVEYLGGNLYRFYVEGINLSTDANLDLLGFQYGGSDTFDNPITATLHEFRIIKDLPSKSTLESEHIRRLSEAFKGINVDTEISTNYINVSPTAGAFGFDFTGNNAIQNALDSISDNSEFNRYVINVSRGIYKVSNSSEYLGNPGYPAMVVMKDHVDVVGVNAEETILWAELPYIDADIDSALDRTRHQTVWNWAKDCKMENLTLVAKNTRYVVHQDDLRTLDSLREYVNVNLRFIGDKGALSPWGLGTVSGEINKVTGGSAMSAKSHAWACHNNNNFSKPSVWEFQDYRFITESATRAMLVQNLGSLVNDRLILKGCSFEGRGYKIDYFQNWLRGQGGNANYNHADYKIQGYGNSPFLFVNAVEGFSLRVISNSVGGSSTVRFLSSGSGYDDIIKNPTGTSTSIFPEVKQIDGYTVKDGSIGLPGYAFGNVDLSERIYTSENVNYTSMGTRLGDCSVSNKFLTIEVDGVNYAIVFDQDYTQVSNATILAQINTVLGSAATAEMFAFGSYYYPEMSDVMSIEYNSSISTPILKGEVLTLEGSGVRKAVTGDKIHGVALDDIAVYSESNGEIKGKGRVLKRGYIKAGTPNSNVNFYVRYTGSVNLGDRFIVNNGVLENNSQGNIYLRDSGIVAINC